jgi:hypothetical protein
MHYELFVTTSVTAQFCVWYADVTLAEETVSASCKIEPYSGVAPIQGIIHLSQKVDICKIRLLTFTDIPVINVVSKPIASRNSIVSNVRLI